MQVKVKTMEEKRKPILRKFASLEDAQRADDTCYGAMSESERSQEFLCILQTFRPNDGRIERVVSTYPLNGVASGDYLEERAK